MIDTTRWPGVLTDRIQDKPSPMDVDYGKPERATDPDWRWTQLWEQENPRPAAEDFKVWWSHRQLEDDRVWVAYCFPQFRVWEWSNEDVRVARRICARHVCSVCGRTEDEGCTYGC